MASRQVGHARRRHLVLLAAIMTLLLSLASGVWAMPNQRALRQTVPTRTPTKPPDTPTPEPPTATPELPTATPEPPPTATPEPPPTATPELQPVQQETAIPEEPTPEPTATPTRKKSKPTPAPTEAAPQAVADEAQAQLTATAEAITSVGYAETGGNYVPLVVGGVFLLAVLAFTVGYVLRRRLASDNR